jgi:hypothetical protein
MHPRSPIDSKQAKHKGSTPSCIVITLSENKENLESHKREAAHHIQEESLTRSTVDFSSEPWRPESSERTHTAVYLLQWQ